MFLKALAVSGAGRFPKEDSSPLTAMFVGAWGRVYAVVGGGGSEIGSTRLSGLALSSGTEPLAAISSIFLHTISAAAQMTKKSKGMAANYMISNDESKS